MKKILKTSLKALGLILAAYCTWVIVVVAYDFITVAMPDHNKQIAERAEQN